MWVGCGNCAVCVCCGSGKRLRIDVESLVSGVVKSFTWTVVDGALDRIRLGTGGTGTGTGTRFWWRQGIGSGIMG